MSRTGFDRLLYAVGDNEADFVGLIVLFVAAAVCGLWRRDRGRDTTSCF
ncbi:hypothetical protein [Mesorhizobium sp. M1403]